MKRYEYNNAEETDVKVVGPGTAPDLWEESEPPDGARALVIGNPWASAYAVLGDSATLERFVARLVGQVAGGSAEDVVRLTWRLHLDALRSLADLRDSTDPGLIDLDRVAEMLRQRGVEAQVEQTGGGCATLYAGPVHRDEAGDPRYAIAVGPGYFAGPGFTGARAYREELVIGPDGDETAPLATPPGATDADVAAIVQALITLGTTAPARRSA